MPVSTARTLTVAPTMAAPVGSVTAPSSTARSICANVARQQTIDSNVSSSVDRPREDNERGEERLARIVPPHELSTGSRRAACWPQAKQLLKPLAGGTGNWLIGDHTSSVG